MGDTWSAVAPTLLMGNPEMARELSITSWATDADKFHSAAVILLAEALLVDARLWQANKTAPESGKRVSECRLQQADLCLSVWEQVTGRRHYLRDDIKLLREAK